MAHKDPKKREQLFERIAGLKTRKEQVEAVMGMGEPHYKKPEEAEGFVSRFARKRAYGKTMEEGRKMQTAFKKRKNLDEYGRPR